MPDCWRRPLCETSWGPKTCTRSSATERASPLICRCLLLSTSSHVFYFALFLFLEIYISGGVGRGNGAVGHQSGTSWDVSRCCHWCCWHHCHSVIVKMIVVVKLNLLSKDARLPVQLQRAMAAEAEAAREARAKVVVTEICSLQNLIQIWNN